MNVDTHSVCELIPFEYQSDFEMTLYFQFTATIFCRTV